MTSASLASTAREQGRGLGTLQVHPALLVLLARLGGVGQQGSGERVEALAPPRLRGDPVHGHPVDGLGPRGQLVAPGQRVQGGGGEHLDLVAPVCHEVLGHHAGAGLRSPPDLRAVAGHHVGHLHDGPVFFMADRASS